ncbi:MAG: FIST signal transduction protein [Phycisphaerales bacterium]
MTDIAVAQSSLPQSHAAGLALSEEIRGALNGEPPDALILFASPEYDYKALIDAIHDSCAPRALVGCSSAGEFKGAQILERSACAIAIRSDEMMFSAGIGQGLSDNRASVAQALVDSFDGDPDGQFAYHSAMILTDALAGHAEDVTERMTLLTAGRYQLFGGGAGDDARFKKTQVFCGREVASNAAVALEILSNKPIGIGVHHGWQPASKPMRVTESDGMRLVSVNMTPAVEVFEEHARATGQTLDRNDPIPFFLHNVIGIQSGDEFKLRVPLEVHADGSIVCAAEISEGSTIFIMATSNAAAADAAIQSVETAMGQLGEHRPKVGIFFDCVATRLRTGREFDGELASVQSKLGAAALAGCNSYGQIARREGQYGGFHNCTAVIGVIPE